MAGPELPVYVMFVNVAGRLRILRVDEPIFLPRQRIGELLHTCKMQVTRYCDNAIENKYLGIGGGHSFVRRRALEYRFVVDRFPELREPEIPNANVNWLQSWNLDGAKCVGQFALAIRKMLRSLDDTPFRFDRSSTQRLQAATKC